MDTVLARNECVFFSYTILKLFQELYSRHLNQADHFVTCNIL